VHFWTNEHNVPSSPAKIQSTDCIKFEYEQKCYKKGKSHLVVHVHNYVALLVLFALGFIIYHYFSHITAGS